MMHPMMRGCVKYKTKWPKVTYQFSMNKELVEKVELAVDQHLRGWYEQGKRKIKPVSKPSNTL